MQLLNIAAIALELFGAAFILIGLAAHLHYHWQNPHAIELQRFDRKLAAVEAIAAVVEPTPLLLPPAPELHPFEMSLERMPEVEAIAAVHQPAAEVEPPAPIELPLVEDAPIDYQAMSSTALRTICTQRGIRWRSVKAGKHLSKSEMITALS